MGWKGLAFKNLKFWLSNKMSSLNKWVWKGKMLYDLK